jgi:flagellum-specific peptidoglycan hydrolase FlgJ
MRLLYIFSISIVCFLGLSAHTSWNSSPKLEGVAYVTQYQDLAVAEMYRTGIPASIILAQGMHESNYGSSNLATLANNHFGIKCKTYWKGQTYYHKDDDLDAKGDLIESCFRAYNDAIESYIDHSNFLQYSGNYSWMFTLSRTDFTAWAYGLKNSGYATDKNYAYKLIKLIEVYNLDRFDTAQNPLTR